MVLFRDEGKYEEYDSFSQRVGARIFPWGRCIRKILQESIRGNGGDRTGSFFRWIFLGRRREEQLGRAVQTVGASLAALALAGEECAGKFDI